MKWLQLAFGVATFLPGVAKLREKGTGGTISARYCYSVWLRHLVMAQKNNLGTDPRIVAELGPGDSLGIGLAALISGSERYYAFDVVKHANLKMNLKIFDELVDLFQKKEDIPSEDEFPSVKPYLDKYDFPSAILNNRRMEYALNHDRIKKIRDALSHSQVKNSVIQYKIPWSGSSIIKNESVDMIFSQAVLEHVDDLKEAYGSMYSWLKDTGYMSHQIDFKCHGLASEWNGHWKYSNFIWKLIRGRRAWLINRAPYSKHCEIIKNNDFKIVFEKKVTLKSSLQRKDLAVQFKLISGSDLNTAGLFIQATKAS